MKICVLIFLLFFAVVQSQAQCGRDRAAGDKKTDVKEKTMPEDTSEFENLPAGVTLTDEVREEIRDESGRVVETKIITVGEKLKMLGARQDKDRLVDRKGREIKFYKPPVRGVSEGVEADRRQARRDREELEKLREKYTVIVLYVNPLKVM